MQVQLGTSVGLGPGTMRLRFVCLRLEIWRKPTRRIRAVAARTATGRPAQSNGAISGMTSRSRSGHLIMLHQRHGWRYRWQVVNVKEPVDRLQATAVRTRRGARGRQARGPGDSAPRLAGPPRSTASRSAVGRPANLFSAFRCDLREKGRVGGRQRNHPKTRGRRCGPGNARRMRSGELVASAAPAARSPPTHVVPYFGSRR